MIIARSPLRISLGGGGTDLPSYSRQHGGRLVAGAIDKYVYITINETFSEEYIIKYSKMERTKRVEDIQHPLIREALLLVGAPQRRIEITSMADIPAGTGLGSSGSFLTALLQALHAYRKSIVGTSDLAAEACHIEIDRLGEPVGRQDQWIAAHGGVTLFEYHPNDDVTVAPLGLPDDIQHDLEDNLLLFFTGYARSASSILAHQNAQTAERDPCMEDNLHVVKDLGIRSEAALCAGNLDEFAELMNVHWELKKQRSPGMTNTDIDNWHAMGLKNGALGGKLIGAGGGGFLMFYAEDKVPLRRCMRDIGLPELRFRFDFEGTKVVVQ